jgi:DNA-binding Lrp family transcriptional regulator
MARHSFIRERVLVAKAENNEAELQRLRKRILDAFAASGGSLVKASERLHTSQMTLRRAAEDLGIEQDLKIDRARSAPILLFSQARVAVESGDSATVEAIKQKVLDAVKAAGRSGHRGAAERLGISLWGLKRTIETLGLGADLFTGKYSSLGERILVAKQTQNAEELRGIKLEILDAVQRNKDIRDAAAELGITSSTLRNIAVSLGLSKAIGFETNEVVLFLARVRVAVEDRNQKSIAALKKELLDAVASSSGSLKRAAASLGLAPLSIRHAIGMLGLTQKIREDFPGQGKERRLTVRVDGRDVTHTVAEWARLRGIKRTTILYRLKKGKSHEEAISVEDLRASRSE